MGQQDGRGRVVDGESGGGRQSAASGAARSGLPLRRGEQKTAMSRLDADGDARRPPRRLFEPLPPLQVGTSVRELPRAGQLVGTTGQ